MSRILLRATSIEKGKTVGHGVLIALGIAATLLAVILLLAGERAPRGAENVLMIAGPIGVLLLITGLWKYYAVRGDLFITHGNSNTYGVTIVNSRKAKVVELYSPFTIKCYYDLQRMSKHNSTYFLYIVFFDQANKPVLLLESGRAAILGKPDGWTQLQEGNLSGVDKVYTCSHISEVSKVLRAFAR